VIMGILTIIVITLMFPKGESLEYEISEGVIWLHDDLIAPFSFPIKKSEEIYKAELRDAEEKVFPIFLNLTEIPGRAVDSIKNYGNYLIQTLDQSAELDTTPIFNPTFLTPESYARFKNLRIQERNLVQGNNPVLRNLFKRAEMILSSIYNKGILSIESDLPFNDSIAIRSGFVDRIESTGNYLFFDEAKYNVSREINKLNYPTDIEKALIEYTVNFLSPNLKYSAELTDEEIEQAKSNISRYTDIVNENERIIAKHERISKETKLKIESYKEAKGEAIGEGGLFLQGIGKFIHIALLISLLVMYLYLFRKKIFYDNQKLLLISILIVFVSFMTFLVNQVEVPAPVQFLIFIPAASMLLTIMFDSRVGFYTTVILTLITGALRGNDYTFMAMNFIAGGIAVYTVRDIKNRSQIFRSFLFILLSYFLTILAFGLERFAPWNLMLIEFAFAASNALISPVLTYGLLIFFEKMFKITTDLTLLELSNFDRPLLKDLARKAPGTFNHSMTIGTIAEAAAEKINANPLLARVGAYYHDIGKTITPQNFVENQLDNNNIHENLKPEQSVNLIRDHVQEGINLALENGLPQEVIDFIPMHHGTSIMSYFYEKAKEQDGEEESNEKNFRYPGPKPNSKETSIIMLADGCESAVRSIEEPDPTKVENVIDNIFKSRIEDRQLDESPVTYADISKMKEAFLSILLGQHHRRIKYPNQEEVEKGVEEEKPE
ncbi:MAG: HDIG domain-containing protein, partial [Ignavibacteriaceae bacterium]|nr:HDIG domain-containing protein [Ignavibacteriaceae bacterium]